jgi:hypothetical protein
VYPGEVATDLHAHELDRLPDWNRAGAEAAPLRPLEEQATGRVAILFPLAVFAVLARLALEYGAESRPGFDERPEDQRFGSSALRRRASAAPAHRGPGRRSPLY